MVNRILIRIKVVQMLYSYLLTRSEFRINEKPETASRDRSYAYQTYIDLLLLLMELSGYSVKPGQSAPALDIDPKLAANRVARALSTNDAIRTAIVRGPYRLDTINSQLQRLAGKIQSSKVFADYSRKQKRELADDVLLWTTIFETIIVNDAEIVEALRSLGDYSNQGFRQGITDLCSTLRSYADSRAFFAKAKSDLTASLDKAYELYLMLFGLIIDITDEQERRIEVNRQKHLATSLDLNPNMRLVENKLVAYLRDSESLMSLMEEYKVHPLPQADPLSRGLLDKILESDIYKAYAESEAEPTLQSDTEFWRDVMRSIILPSDLLAEELEDKSVYWNDDLQTMGTFVLKTLRQIAQSDGKHIEMLPKYKDLEDERFGPDLFRYAVENQENYRGYIEMFIQRDNWDPDRLAYMDIVILTTAIAEIINYPLIPAPVSVNEYVEIANNYSTERSGAFINGMLYSITNYLNEQGIINKK